LNLVAIVVTAAIGISVAHFVQMRMIESSFRLWRGWADAVFRFAYILMQAIRVGT